MCTAATTATATINGNHPDYLPLSIANILFGGTFTARLSQEIREKSASPSITKTRLPMKASKKLVTI